LHSGNSVEGCLRVKGSCYESRNHSWMRCALSAMCSTGGVRAPYHGIDLDTAKAEGLLPRSFLPRSPKAAVARTLLDFAFVAQADISTIEN
jgi:hypothetical protein